MSSSSAWWYLATRKLRHLGETAAALGQDGRGFLGAMSSTLNQGLDMYLILESMESMESMELVTLRVVSGITDLQTNIN